MSVEIWNLDKDLCRCCHAQGSFDNLAQPKVYLVKEEIYSDMLKDCFDIDISPVPGELCAITYKICETCVVTLRHAAVFKKQVQECEQKFMELYTRNAIKVSNTSMHSVVKEELPDSFIMEFKQEDLSQIDDENNDGDDGDDDDYCQECEEEQITDTATIKHKDKTKNRIKEKKAKQKRDRPRKDKEVSYSNDKEKGKKGVRSVFKLEPGDYKKLDGKYICSRCDKTYDHYSAIRYHIKIQHYKIPKYTCQYCMKGFMTLAPLTIHKLQDHNIDERYRCNACKGTFNTKVTLRKHINNYHMLGESYKCDLCDYESYSFEGLYKHKFKHRTSKDYHCSYCKKSFLRKTTLDLHVRIHTDDRRKVCNICSLAFVQKSSLNYHMKKNHPDVNF